MEKYIIEKFGKEVGSMICLLGRNYYAIGEQFGLSFGISEEARIAALSYSVKLIREQYLQNRDDESLEILSQISDDKINIETNEEMLKKEIEEQDDDDEHPDLDFTKGL